jgi:hypothetical protein
MTFFHGQLDSDRDDRILEDSDPVDSDPHHVAGTERE